MGLSLREINKIYDGANKTTSKSKAKHQEVTDEKRKEISENLKRVKNGR